MADLSSNSSHESYQSPRIQRLRERKRDLERGAESHRLSTPYCPITTRHELPSRHDHLWTPGIRRASPRLQLLRERKRQLDKALSVPHRASQAYDSSSAFGYRRSLPRSYGRGRIRAFESAAGEFPRTSFASSEPDKFYARRKHLADLASVRLTVRNSSSERSLASKDPTPRVVTVKNKQENNIRCGRCHQCQNETDQSTYEDGKIVKCLVRHFDEVGERTGTNEIPSTDPNFQAKFDLRDKSKEDEESTASTHLIADENYSHDDVSAHHQGDTVSSLGSTSFHGSQSNTVISSAIAKQLEFLKNQLKEHGDTLNKLVKQGHREASFSANETALIDDTAAESASARPTLQKTASGVEPTLEHTDVDRVFDSDESFDGSAGSSNREKYSDVESLQLQLLERNLQISQLLEELAQLKTELSNSPSKLNEDDTNLPKKKVFSANFAFGEAKRAVKGSIEEVQDLEMEFKTAMDNFSEDFDKVLSEMNVQQAKRAEYDELKLLRSSLKPTLVDHSLMSPENIIAEAKMSRQPSPPKLHSRFNPESTTTESQVLSELLPPKQHMKLKPEEAAAEAQTTHQQLPSKQFSQPQPENEAAEVDSPSQKDLAQPPSNSSPLHQQSPQDNVSRQQSQNNTKETGSITDEFLSQSIAEDGAIDSLPSLEQSSSPEKLLRQLQMEDVTAEVQSLSKLSPLSILKDVKVQNRHAETEAHCEQSPLESLSGHHSGNTIMENHSQRPKVQPLRPLRRRAEDATMETPPSRRQSSKKSPQLQPEGIEAESNLLNLQTKPDSATRKTKDTNNGILQKFGAQTGGSADENVVPSNSLLQCIGDTAAAIEFIEKSITEQKISERSGIYQIEMELKAVRAEVAQLGNAIQDTVTREIKSPKKGKNRLKSLMHALVPMQASGRKTWSPRSG